MSKRDLTKLMELTINSAYEAVLHEQSWESALTHLTSLTGANSSTYVVINEATPEIIQTHALDPAIMQSYNNDFALHDPFHGQIMHTGGSRVVLDKREVDQSFIRRSVWFQEFYRQHKIQSMMALPLFDAGNLAGSFNIQRSTEQGEFSQQEFEAMSKVAPHLVRAAQISAKMNSLRRSAQLGNSVLDKLSVPILLLEENGKVVLTNRAAEQLIQQEPALKLTKDRFTISINGVTISPCTPQKITETLIRRSNNRKPLRMTSMPLAANSALNTTWQRPLCLLMFNDPELLPVSLSELLQTLFHLTLSEVRVCIAIGVDGLSPQECSEQSGVSITTTRTQIRGIYLKMGVKRQVELVKVLTMLSLTRSDD